MNFLQNNNRWVYKIIFLLFLSLQLNAQEEDLSQNLKDEDPQREEIQRYFGYEDLLYRYITLPYDISANVNQRGKYVDIGYLLFAFIPILILGILYKRRKFFYSMLVCLCLYLLLCFNFSFLFDSKSASYNPIGGQYPAPPAQERMDGSFLSPVYELAGVVMHPLISVLNSVTGSQDHVTYPLVCGLFLIFLFGFFKLKEISDRSRTIGGITIFFFFLWWILSGGIIWYGFLLIPLCYGAISKYFQVSEIDFKAKSTLKYLFLISLTSWIFLSYSSRISNVNVLLDKNHPDLGKLIVESRTIPYAVGIFSREQCLEVAARNISSALKIINEDSSLIYKVGTSLAFEIKNNHLRLFEDNNLSYFYSLIQKHKTKENFVAVLKSSGFKYILIDLLLPSLDRTPEKSLREKYRVFLGKVISDNPGLRLLATDRIVVYQSPEGTKTDIMEVFGTEIREIGTYAIYEII